MKLDRASNNLAAKDVKRLLLGVYRDFRGGELTNAQANQASSILSTILKAIEIDDVEQRLRRIEELMHE